MNYPNGFGEPHLFLDFMRRYVGISTDESMTLSDDAVIT